MESEKSERWDDQDDVVNRECAVQGFSVTARPGVLEKMFGWCRAAESEVSGMFLVEKEGSAFEIIDAFILPQESSSAYTELDIDGMTGLISKLARKKMLAPNRRLGWWHTHYNFSCFWSSTDVATATRLCGLSKDWMLSIVLNQKFEYLCRLDVFEPVRMGMDNIKIGRGLDISKKDEARYKSDVKRLVREKVYSYQGYSGGGGHPAPGGYIAHTRYDYSDPNKPVKWEDGKRFEFDKRLGFWIPAPLQGQGELPYWEEQKLAEEQAASWEGYPGFDPADVPKEGEPKEPETHESKVTKAIKIIETELDHNLAAMEKALAKGWMKVEDMLNAGYVKISGKWVYRGKPSAFKQDGAERKS